MTQNHWNKVIVTAMCIVVLGSSTILAQENQNRVLKNQITFTHDNDFILLTDRYYSSGLFLTYRRRLEKGLFIPEMEQLAFKISQIANTPNNIESIEISDFDRPYAGFLGLDIAWSLADAKAYYSASVLLGVTGPISGAGHFQRWYHDNIVLFKTPTWFTEIENSFHANVQLDYAKEWQLAPNPFGIYMAFEPKVAFGTKDIFAQPQMAMYFGRRNPLYSSLAYQRINSTEKEIYVAFRASYRHVIHNAFFEGNLLGDNSAFIVAPKQSVLHLGFDFHHRAGNNNYVFGYRYISKEAATVRRHKFLRLSYGRSF